MQIKGITSTYEKQLGWLVRFAVLGLALYQIGQLSGSRWIDSSLPVDDLSFWSVTVLALLLVPVNWFIEIRKWQYLLPSIDMQTATKGVLMGQTLNWVFPLTLGDVFGRSLGTTKNKELIKALFLNRVSSLIVTLVFASGGLLFYLELTSWSELELVICTIAVVGLFLITYSLIDRKTAVALIYATIRYGVFAFQFLILVAYFNPSLTLLFIWLGISFTFLIRSLLPSLAGAIGVREASMLTFFSCCASSSDILIPSLMIWVLNLILPSLAGMLFLFRSQKRWAWS